MEYSRVSDLLRSRSGRASGRSDASSQSPRGCFKLTYIHTLCSWNTAFISLQRSASPFENRRGEGPEDEVEVRTKYVNQSKGAQGFPGKETGQDGKLHCDWCSVYNNYALIASSKNVANNGKGMYVRVKQLCLPSGLHDFDPNGCEGSRPQPIHETSFYQTVIFCFVY